MQLRRRLVRLLVLTVTALAVAAVPGTAAGQICDQPDPVDRHHCELGGDASVIGPAVSAPYAVAGGRAREYRAGTIYWSSATGAAEVHGSIRLHYLARGGPAGFLGFPRTDESPVAGGRVNEFVGGAIYWSPMTPPQEVHGSILVRYRALGGPAGVLGFPLSDELTTRDRIGRVSTFQRGAVYWSLATGANEVYGAIHARYLALGAERSVLGYPVTGELSTPTRPGRFNGFQRGSVYWSVGTGAHEVYGDIREAWAAERWERGPLGLPVSGEYGVPGGRRSDFQGGSLVWAAATGRIDVLPTGPVATTVWGVRPTTAAVGADTTRLATTAPVVAITVDLGGGSDAGVDRVLRALADRDAFATFFPTGDWARRFPHRVVQIAHAGHVIGNHSDTHPDFTTLTDAQIADQLSRADAAISARIGRTSKPLFRFPFGARLQADINAVNGNGYAAVRWTTDTLGWLGTTGDRPQSVASVVARALGGAVPGQIVLMHGGASPDGRVLDAEALPAVLDGYRARGFGTTTLSGLTR